MRTLWLAVAVAACGGGAEDPTPCAGEDCFCATTADCPGTRGCLEESCFAAGEVPRAGQCAEDADCIDGVCEQGNESTPPEDWFCTSACESSTTVGCPDGWACYQTGVCLPLNSLPTGARCVNSLLCAESDTCVNNICHTLCVAGYSLVGCPEGQYCYVSNPPHCREGKACVPETDEFCAPPKVCVELGAGVRECRVPCSYAVVSGLYEDDCTEAIGFYATTCAPIGISDVAVCIEVGEEATGQGCNGGTRRCQRGNVCFEGFCRALCTSQISCADGTCNDVATGFRACL